jgi:cytochrome b561
MVFGARFRVLTVVVIAIHVLAAMAHNFIYRDRIMQRMVPGLI